LGGLGGLGVFACTCKHHQAELHLVHELGGFAARKTTQAELAGLVWVVLQLAKPPRPSCTWRASWAVLGGVWVFWVVPNAFSKYARTPPGRITWPANSRDHFPKLILSWKTTQTPPN
jgi:hypothetical protein